MGRRGFHDPRKPGDRPATPCWHTRGGRERAGCSRRCRACDFLRVPSCPAMRWNAHAPLQPFAHRAFRPRPLHQPAAGTARPRRNRGSRPRPAQPVGQRSPGSRRTRPHRPRHSGQCRFAPGPQRPGHPGEHQQHQRRGSSPAQQPQRPGRRYPQPRHQLHRHPRRWRYRPLGARLQRPCVGDATVRRHAPVHRHGHGELPQRSVDGRAHRRDPRPGLGAVRRRRHRRGDQRGAEEAFRRRDPQPPAPRLRLLRQPPVGPGQRRLADRQPQLPAQPEPAAEPRLDRPWRLAQPGHQRGAALAGQRRSGLHPRPRLWRPGADERLRHPAGRRQVPQAPAREELQRAQRRAALQRPVDPPDQRLEPFRQRHREQPAVLHQGPPPLAQRRNLRMGRPARRAVAQGLPAHQPRAGADRRPPDLRLPARPVRPRQPHPGRRRVQSA